MRAGWLICAVGISITAGCHKRNSAEERRTRVGTGSVCAQRILEPGDLAGILRAPITHLRALPGDAQSCEFATDGFPAIVISVRPGVGRTTLDTWKAGKMPVASTALPGVGEAAVWQAPLQELLAEKNGLLCDIQVRGTGADLAIDAQALPAAIGVLCNKIFDAYLERRRRLAAR